MTARNRILELLKPTAPLNGIDYVEVRHAEDLSRLGPGPIGEAPARVLAAAWIGKTRLIDNMEV